jgi:hypothetical protein
MDRFISLQHKPLALLPREISRVIEICSQNTLIHHGKQLLLARGLFREVIQFEE